MEPEDSGSKHAPEPNDGDGARQVLVIGAGAAGISAARNLQRLAGSAVRVIVLEARCRMGGRIDTRSLADGTCVDMGAAWVHGACSANPIAAIAARIGDGAGSLVETDDHDEVTFEAIGTVDAPGPSRRLPEADHDSIAKHMALTWSLHKGQQRKARAAAPASPGTEVVDPSLWESLCALRTKRFGGVASLSERGALLFRWSWAYETEHDYAAPLEAYSSLWWDVDEAHGGGDWLWRHGYSVLIDHLAQGLDVRLDARVTRIARGSEGGLTVTLSDGETLNADACISTLPLGVLQAGHVAFDPPLSPRKSLAIRRLGVGLLNKAAMRFERCFWASPSGHQPHVLFRVPLEAARTRPEALESPYMVNLQPVTGSCVLVAYFTCETARHMESLSDSQVEAALLAMLASMYTAEVVSSASLVEIVISRWAEDDLACASEAHAARALSSLHAVGAPTGPCAVRGAQVWLVLLHARGRIARRPSRAIEA